MEATPHPTTDTAKHVHPGRMKRGIARIDQLLRLAAEGTALAVVFALVPFALVLFPTLASVRGSRSDPCANNLIVLATALSLYAENNHGFLPPMRDAEEAGRALADYLLVTDQPGGRRGTALVDPRTGGLFRPNPQRSGRKLASFGPAQAQTVAFWDTHADRSGRWRVAMLDGTLRSLPAGPPAESR
jgi:hypothetical protein